MNNFIDEYMRLKHKYDNLKKDFEKQGKRNNELHLKNQSLVSENTVLKEIVSEKLDIIPDVLEANIKLYRQEKRTRDVSIRVNEFIKQSKEYQNRILRGGK